MKNIGKLKLGALGLIIATVALAAGYERIPRDRLILGSGTASDKTLEFDNGAANPAKIKLNNTTGALQFSNDGQNFLDFGSGAASGINFIENADAETSATEGLTLSGVASSQHSGAQIINGKQSFLLTPSGAFTADWALASIPARWDGNNFGIEALVDVPALDSGVTLTVGLHDGTEFVESYEITQSDTYRVQLIASYDNGKTYTFRIASTAGTPTASGLVYVDDVYVGPSVPVIGQVKPDPVQLRYTVDGAQGINNLASTKLNYNTKTFNNYPSSVDTSSHFIFTAPRQGKYSVKATAYINDNTSFNSYSEAVYLYITKNGAETYAVGPFERQNTSGVSAGIVPRVNTSVPLDAGDTIEIQLYQNSGSNLAVNATVNRSYVEIYELDPPSLTTYAVSPQIEYAYNNSGLTTAGGIDTSSFAYGPEGVAIGNIASTTNSGSSSTRMAVRFKSQIRDSDSLDIQIKINDSTPWLSASQLTSIANNLNHSNAYYGIALRENSDKNEVLVYFGNAGRIPTSTTYGGNGSSWSAVASWKWRVRKISAGAAAIPVADARNYGTTKINQIIEKIDDSYRTSTANNLLALNNVPGGWYRLSVGADYFYQVSGSTSAAIIDPVLNGNTIPIADDTIRVGYTDASTVDSQIYSNGLTTSRLVFFPNATNTFWINVTIQVAGSAVNDAFYTLERLQNVEVITNQWD